MPIWIKYIWKEINLVFCTFLTICINTIVYLVTIFCLSDKLITHASFVCGIVSAICSFIIMLMAFRTNAKIKSKIAILNLKHRFENLQKIPMSGGYLAEQEALCLKDDLETTRRIVKAGMLMGIEVTDHIIVGNGECYSMYCEGDMDMIKKSLSEE